LDLIEKKKIDNKSEAIKQLKETIKHIQNNILSECKSTNNYNLKDEMSVECIFNGCCKIKYTDDRLVDSFAPSFHCSKKCK